MTTRFLVDDMLGTLVTYLRMCGYDTASTGERAADADDEIRALAEETGRVLVTRDRQLAASTHGALLIESRDVTDQLGELVAHGVTLELTDPTRCSRCNGELERTEDPTPEYAPSPDETPVWRCVSCGQHYWLGSHWDDVEERLRGL